MCNRDDPEDVVRIDVRVVVVNLFRKIGRSDWTGVQVESNESKRSVVTTAVSVYKRSLIETHIGLKRQILRLTSLGVGPDPASTNPCESHEPVEVGDVGGLVDIGQRRVGQRWKMVDKNPEWRKRPESNLNRFGPSGLMAMFIITRQEHVGAQQPGSDDSARACRPPKERTAGNRETTSPSR